MAEDGKQLNAGGSVTLTTVSGVVTGRVSLGPDDSRGPAIWIVDTIIMKTSRPGVAPIPRVEVYLTDVNNFAMAQFISYDGSFSNAGGNCVVTRGEKLVAVWTGGTAGDTAFFTLTGTKR